MSTEVPRSRLARIRDGVEALSPARPESVVLNDMRWLLERVDELAAALRAIDPERQFLIAARALHRLDGVR